MTASQHPTHQQLERYRQRVLGADELIAVDDHLAACAECREGLERSIASGDFARVVATELEKDSGLEPFHLDYEQLESYVDGRASGVDREIVESHIGLCRLCSLEIAELQHLKQTEALYDLPRSNNAQSPIAFPASRSWPSTALQWLGQAAAVVVLAVAVSWITTSALRTQLVDLRDQVAALKMKNDNLEHQLAELQRDSAGPRELQATVEVLHDRSGEIRADRGGKIVGLPLLGEAHRNLIQRTLSEQRVETPSDMGAIARRTGSLLGPGGRTLFAPQSPVGTVISTDRPTFRWSSVENAASYVISVYDLDFIRVLASPPVSAASWQPPSALPRGSIYVWQVTVTVDGKSITAPVPPAPEARFKILEAGRLEEVRTAEKSNSYLVAGVIYARLGMIDDAEREFQRLARANPSSALVSKLLRDLRNIRSVVQ